MLSLNDKLQFIQRAFGTYRISRDCRNVDVKCPICDPKDKTKLKLSILTEDSDDRCLACHCWTCGYRSRSLWSLLFKHCSRELLFEFRDKFLPESMRHRVHEDDVQKAPEVLRLPDDFRLFASTGVRDPDVLAMRKYLVNRQINERDLWHYKLGYSEMPGWRHRIIVPSFDANGKLNWYVGRKISSKVYGPKYEAPPGDRRHVIFNELNVDWKQRLVLCEGSFDMMKCGDNAVPLLGSDLSVESALFNAIVVNGTPIALAMDADMRTTKLPVVAQKLADYDIDVIIVRVPSDPGEMSKHEFKAALQAAQPFDWQQTFFDKLERASKLSL